MKKKIVAIIFCTLMTIATIPIVESHADMAIPKIVLNTLQPSSQLSWLQLQKLLASDGVIGDAFGLSVSLSGDTALISAPYCDNTKGAVYVFTRTTTGWTQQTKLTASDGTTFDYFGFSVSLSGDTALIGAPLYSNGYGKGSAYIFTRDGTVWTQQAQLNASDGINGDTFGMSVSLSGDTALIGAYAKGSAYVFIRTGTIWSQQAELFSADGVVNDAFGYSVSLHGDTALIGAYAFESSKGSAYVFTRTGTSWTQQAQLNASDGMQGASFGGTVSVWDNTALIGAYMQNGKGSAYVFTRTGSSWSLQAELFASDGQLYDSFGWSVFLYNDIALIGAIGCGLYRGSVYVFTRYITSWTQQQKLRPSDVTPDDQFGIGLSLANDTALISAPNWDSGLGSAYIYINEKPPNPPIIHGPASGKAKQTYDYSFTSTDPNYDNVSYFIDWGDNTTSGWIGPYASGMASTQSHSWSKQGSYTIKAKAKDIYGNESDWGTLQVTMPLSYEPPHIRFFEWLFERFPRAFPILRHLLGR